MLDQTHDEVLGQITDDVEEALAELQPLNEVYEHSGTPLRTRVELSDVRKAAAAGAARCGTMSTPGFGGYSPEGVFRKVVEKTRQKASERQTEGVIADARALVVCLWRAKMIAEHLSQPAHLDGAEAEITHLDPMEYGLDVIAFVVRALPQGLAAPLMVADDATLTVEQAKAMFVQPA